MGKLAKPQRSKKHKKIKAVDPFYVGSRKDARKEGLNQKPKNFEQEVPKKLRHLGFSISGVRSGKVGKKSKNKFQKHPDAPHKYNNQFSVPLGAKPDSKKNESKQNSSEVNTKSKRFKKDKKGLKRKLSGKEINDYVDNLKPSKPFMEPFSFKKKTSETDALFMKRVNQETNRVLTKSQIDDKFEISDEKKLLLKLKTKTGMSDKKKQRLKEKKKKKVLAVKGKREEKLLDFGSLQDKVVFGDVVHAPPVLSVRPKKAVVTDVDRPGLRMPELKAIIDSNIADAKSSQAENSMSGKVERQIGKSIKRKALSTVQRHIADSQRDKFIDAYRHRKLSKHSV